MANFYDSFQDFKFGRNDADTSQAKYRSEGNESHLKVLEDKIDSLYLLNLAALELLNELGISKEKIESKIEEIDLRDGKADGKVSSPTNCPDCGHRISKKRTHCFFCGSKVNSF
ncbi:MAG: hypothetical protein CL589_21240 [Alteromonadaceae bacterium]|nr:hypothetical protein [Alteromonadaceae bacterium]MAX45131.1 hypothetical protein [Alteromonadaceae bacterium]|tara:strand:- start:61 stop:402 length:342 start_codon:yes stop_codon:yes gene_type:complete